MKDAPKNLGPSIKDLEERVEKLEMGDFGLENLEEIVEISSEICENLRSFLRKLYTPMPSLDHDKNRKEDRDIARKVALRALREKVDRFKNSQSGQYEPVDFTLGDSYDGDRVSLEAWLCLFDELHNAIRHKKREYERAVKRRK